MGGGQPLFLPVLGHRDGHGRTVLDVHGGGGGLQADLAPHLDDLVGTVLPHHPGSVLRILEFLDQARDLLRTVPAFAGHRGTDRLPHRVPQGHALDALRTPVGGELRRRDTPDLLVVRLEEVMVEAPPIVRDDVALEGVEVLRGPDSHPQEREPAAHRLDQAEVGEGVPELDRIVVEFPLVEDPAHPGAKQEVLGGQHFVPELLDRSHLGEEPVATDVEPPAVPLHGPADAPDHGVLLDHHHRVATLGQLSGRGEARRPSTDDDNRVTDRPVARLRGRLGVLTDSRSGRRCLVIFWCHCGGPFSSGWSSSRSTGEGGLLQAPVPHGPVPADIHTHRARQPALGTRPWGPFTPFLRRLSSSRPR